MEVWHTEDPHEAWNVTLDDDPSPAALYAWQLDVRYWDGLGERSRSSRGHVQVLR